MNLLKTLFMTSPDSKSGIMQLDKSDLQKTIRDFMIVACGAGIAYLLEALPTLNFGQNQVIIVPVLTSILTVALRYFRDNSPNKV